MICDFFKVCLEAQNESKIDIDQKFKKKSNQLKTLRNNLDLLHAKIQQLKAKRYSRAVRAHDHNINLSQISKKQLKQYFHLGYLQKKLTPYLQLIKQKNQDIFAAKDYASKDKLRKQIQNLVANSNEVMNQISRALQILKEGKFQYYSDSDRILIKQQRYSEVICSEQDLRNTIRNVENDVAKSRQENKLLVRNNQNQPHQVSSLFQQQKQYIQATLCQNKKFSEIYYQLDEQGLQYCLDQFNVHLDKGSFVLNHSYVPLLDVPKFVSSKIWKNLTYLKLIKCSIDNQKWKLLVSKANNFPDLQILWISYNEISVIQAQQLFAFPLLKFIYLQQNPLNNMTIAIFSKKLPALNIAKNRNIVLFHEDQRLHALQVHGN